MKRIALFIFGLVGTLLLKGQTIDIQSGVSLSSTNWSAGSLNLESGKKNHIGYSIFAGCDYFDKTYFNLASHIGLVQKGGFEIDPYAPNGELTEISTLTGRLNYLSINTTFELKYPIKDKIKPFISFGPHFDYLISHDNIYDDLEKIDALNVYNWGLILGGGIKYDLQRFRIGLRSDYFLNFMKIAKWEASENNTGGEVTDRTFTINFTIGYRL